jgi:hypothetical protein
VSLIAVKSERFTSCFRHAPFTSAIHQPGAAVYKVQCREMALHGTFRAHVTSLSLTITIAGSFHFSKKKIVLMRFGVKHVQFGQNACDQSGAHLWWQWVSPLPLSVEWSLSYLFHFRLREFRGKNKFEIWKSLDWHKKLTKIAYNPRNVQVWKTKADDLSSMINFTMFSNDSSFAPWKLCPWFFAASPHYECIRQPSPRVRNLRMFLKILMLSYW